RRGDHPHGQPADRPVDLVAERPERLDLDLYPQPAATRRLQQAVQVPGHVAHQVEHAHHRAFAAPRQHRGQVALEHRALEERARPAGHVEAGIELAAHALEREEGLDHQRQVGRQGEAVPAQDLGDIGEHGAHPQVLQGYPAVLVDEAADRFLQARLVDVGAVPGPVHQHLGDRPRILVHQPVQQLHDLEATWLRDVPDHAEIDHADRAAGHVEDVPRVRVGVEEAVLQHHLEHDAGTGARQLHPVEPGGVDGGQVAAGNAVEAFLHVEPLAGPGPVDLRDDDVRATFEVARDALGVAAFGGEIEFAPQRGGELAQHV